MIYQPIKCSMLSLIRLHNLRWRKKLRNNSFRNWASLLDKIRILILAHTPYKNKHRKKSLLTSRKCLLMRNNHKKHSLKFLPHRSLILMKVLCLLRLLKNKRSPNQKFNNLNNKHLVDR